LQTRHGTNGGIQDENVWLNFVDLLDNLGLKGKRGDHTNIAFSIEHTGQRLSEKPALREEKDVNSLTHGFHCRSWRSISLTEEIERCADLAGTPALG
jgi:hypothetical protein